MGEGNGRLSNQTFKVISPKSNYAAITSGNVRASIELCTKSCCCSAAARSWSMNANFLLFCLFSSACTIPHLNCCLDCLWVLRGNIKSSGSSFCRSVDGMRYHEIVRRAPLQYALVKIHFPPRLFREKQWETFYHLAFWLLSAAVSGASDNG